MMHMLVRTEFICIHCLLKFCLHVISATYVNSHPQGQVMNHKQKSHSVEWHHKCSMVKRKFKIQQPVKVICSVFWDSWGVILVKFSEVGRRKPLTILNSTLSLRHWPISTGYTTRHTHTINQQKISCGWERLYYHTLRFSSVCTIWVATWCWNSCMTYRQLLPCTITCLLKEMVTTLKNTQQYVSVCIMHYFWGNFPAVRILTSISPQFSVSQTSS